MTTDLQCVKHSLREAMWDRSGCFVSVITAMLIVKHNSCTIHLIKINILPKLYISIDDVVGDVIGVTMCNVFVIKFPGEALLSEN